MVSDLSLKHEYYRKMFHVLAGVGFIGVALLVDLRYGQVALLPLLFIGLLISLVADHLRIERGFKVPFFRFLERAREVGRLHATTYTFIGALLAFLFFERDVAYAAIAMFFVGDAAAAVFGRTWGKGSKFIGKKSVVGTLSMFVFSLIVGWAITSSLPVALVMAFVATLVEAVSEKMDDSFLIIIFAGVAGQIIVGLL